MGAEQEFEQMKRQNAFSNREVVFVRGVTGN